MSASDPMREALGKALGTQYEILRLLGRGGMGAVYLAREHALERTVAIKVLPPEIAASPDAQERFRREARTAAKLTHPNLVSLHTFGEVEGTMYFVMGYVRGESLADRLRRDQRIPPEQVRRILSAMADALDYAHRQGVIHRDIKPDNILLEEESGRPMLTDFGIAKGGASGHTLTELGTAIGTPHYMSPEQASGERDIDGRSDLYSLGVVGYGMLAGRLPFEGTSAQEVLAQHLTKEPAPLKTVAPEAPDDLAKAITRCLAKDPAARWADGASLRDAMIDTGLAEEQLIEKRAWFDGILFGRVAPICWFLALSIPLLSVMIGNHAKYTSGRSALVLAPLPFALPLMVLVSGAILLWVWTFGRSKRWRWTQAPLFAFRQPLWWSGWWPPPLRHPATARRWPRLPRGVRWSQTLLDATVFTLVIAYLPAAVLLWAMPVESIETYASTDWPFLGSLDKQTLFDFASVSVRSAEGETREASLGVFGIRGLFDAVGSTLVYASLLSYMVGVVWAKWRGMSMREAHRLFGGRALAPTYEAIAFWKKPHVARLLVPKPSKKHPSARAEPTTPGDFLFQVNQIAAELTGQSRELGKEAIAAARQIVAAIEALDKEIQKLARDANPSEMVRLEEKLVALEAEGAESTAEHQMRELITNQLRLMRQLADRLQQATTRRGHLLEMLSTLWLQIGNLRAEAARDALAGEEVSGKIRAICEEIERLAEATAEVRQLVSASETE